MSVREQKKYLETLKRYERKFDHKEREDYSMLVKRHKDEEELDKLSIERLHKLYEKYHLNRERKNYDHLFNKPENLEEDKNEE